MRGMVLARLVVSLAFFLGALGMVTWRHSRSLESLAELDEIHRRTSVALAERVELERDIQILTSRQHVVPEARARLGMHTPEVGHELVLLPAEVIQ